VIVDGCGHVSKYLTLWRVVTLEVCGIKGFQNLTHRVLKLIVFIDLDRERGTLIPLTSVENFASSGFERLALWIFENN
jgi:hypothetical protein